MTAYERHLEESIERATHELMGPDGLLHRVAATQAWLARCRERLALERAGLQQEPLPLADARPLAVPA